MKTPAILILTIIFALSAFSQQGLKTGTAAPAFSVAGMDGKTYDLNAFRGKVVVVTFWSSKCPICHEEIPKLNRIAARYRNQDVVFLGLTMENEAKVSSYIRNTPFDFTILPNSFGVVLQYADRDRSGNINMGFPAYFLVNQRGELQLKTSGWDKTSDLDSQISRLLAAQRGSDQSTSASTLK